MLIIKILIAIIGALTAIVFLLMGLSKRRRHHAKTGAIIYLSALALVIAITVTQFLLRNSG